MERMKQMQRLEKLREVIDEIVQENPDDYDRRCGIVHLYGVAQSCVLLAKKRGLDPELAAIMGMLHDIYSYKHGYCPDHAEKGAVLAGEILRKLGILTEQETDLVCTAIGRHSDKAAVDGLYDELLKDADVMQHRFYNPCFPVKEHERLRYEGMLGELGVEVEKTGPAL